MTSLSSDTDRAGRTGHTVGQASWKDLGADLKGRRFASGQELVAAMGLDWRVETVPLVSARNGKPLGNLREVVRTDTQETLGVVKARYRPIQNEEAFGFLPELCGTHGLELHAGGSLDGGSRIWVLAKAGETVLDRTLPNGEKDRIERHILFWNSFDGSTKCRIAAVPFAFWCANTLASAWKNAENRWAITHTRSADQRIRDAAAQLQSALGWMAHFEHEMVELEHQRFTAEQMRGYAEGLLIEVEGLITPKTTEQLGFCKNGDARVDHAVEHRQRRIEKMVGLFQGEGAACRGGTKLDAYQSVTEFLDHHRARYRKGRTMAQQQTRRFEETVFADRIQNFREAALRRLKA